MPSQSRKPDIQSTARLTAAHHRPRTEAKTSQAHRTRPHQTSSARSPFPMRVPLPTNTVRTAASKGGGRSGTAALPCRRRRPSSPRGCCGGRPPSCCTASSASASRPLAAPLSIDLIESALARRRRLDYLYMRGQRAPLLAGEEESGSRLLRFLGVGIHGYANTPLLSCCGRRTVGALGGGVG